MKRSVLLLAVTTACALAGTAACGADSSERPSAEEGRVAQSPASALGPPAAMREVAEDLDDPWELTWGPDNFLWTTEKSGKRITRIDPAKGEKTPVLTIPEVAEGDGQQGLLGFAFGNGTAYVAYSYDSDPGPAQALRGKIVRYTYNQEKVTLTDPVDVITGLPASEDHNAGRLLVGPDQKLYYSIGDQGNNQFDRACLPNGAQDLPTAEQIAARDWRTYTGKILRLNPDGSIPADNPTIRGVRSHIFSYGHRNPQGLVFGPGGRLFANEHGPKSDDEINLIRPGRNYGWPFVAGFRDDQSYRYHNWSAAPDCARLDYDDYEIPASVPAGPRELEWNDPAYTEPLKTIYTVPTGHNFEDETCGENLDLCWPSIAPSSLDYLPAENAPNPMLGNSLLITSLKNGAVYFAKLNRDGNWVQGDLVPLFRTANRYRDVAISPDRTKIYVATDSEGTAGPGSGSQSGKLANPGSILEFSLTG